MTTRLASTIAWLAIPLVAAALLLPGLTAGPSLDAAVFLVAGWRLTQGDVMYVDVWDHKPPGIHLAHALGELLPFLDAWTAVWVLTLAATTLTAILVAGLMRRYVHGSVAALASIACATGLGHYVLSLGGGLSESFAVLPATAALVLSSGTLPRWLAPALAGLLIGVAVIVSPQLAPAGLACLFLLGSASGAGPLVVFVASAAVPIVVMTEAFALQAAAPAFLDAVVGYNAAYRQSTAGALSGPAYGFLPWVTLSLVFLLGPAAAGALAWRRRDPLARQLIGPSLLWIGGSVALTIIQGRLYGHYALSIVVPLSILAAVGLDDAWTALRTRARRFLAGGVLVLTVVLSLSIGAVGAGMELESIQPANRRAHAAADWIAAEGTDAGPILVWGNQPHLYRLSEREPAARYVYLYPLTTDGYATPALVREALAQLEGDPPAYVVDAGSAEPGAPGFLPLLAGRPVATDGRDLDLLDPIRAFVRDRYRAPVEVDGWLIYRARNP